MSVTTRAQMQRAAVTAEPGLAETDSEDAQASELHRSTLNASDQDAAMRLREKELDLEMLRMQIQLQTLRLQEQGIHESEGGRRAKLSGYAKDLRAVLPTMPESDELAPAWFKSAETMLRSCDIPKDAAGAIIVPFLNEKSRTLVANKSEDRVLSYDEIRELVLSELKLTPEEYKRRFYACRKGKESWGQCVTKLEINLDYYLRSRKVETLKQLRALIISDRAKEMMSHELCAYVLQHETGDWFSPMKVAELAEKFEESRALRSQSGVGMPVNTEPKPRTTSNEGLVWSQANERGPPPKCYGCGKFGHVQWSCPQTKPRAATDWQSGNELEETRFAGRAVFNFNGRKMRARESSIESRLSSVDVMCGGRLFKACLDSGADIAILRRSMLPKGLKGGAQ
ncbi:hypothetical protein MTO96_027126 [Rhipicephalus appendiculatus]